MALFGLGAGRGEGARSGLARRIGGAEVVLTKLGGVEALRTGPWIEAGGARSRSGVPSTRLWVGARGWVDAELKFEVEKLIVLLGCISNSTLRLATLVACKLNLPFNCHFASTPDHRLDLPLEVNTNKS